MASSLPLRHLRHLNTAAASDAAAAAATASSISISKAKSKLRSEHDPDKALEIYSSVSDHYSSPVSSRYAQDLAVRRLAKARRFSDIESLIEAHKSDPKIKQEPFLSTLIRSYGLAGMFDNALATYHQMDQLGTRRSSVSFNALLSACNQSRRFDQVPILFSEIPSKYGVKPDKITYGVLIKSYCASGKPEKGLEILREMEEKGVEVTAVTFTTILDSLYKKGKSEDAERLWSRMAKKGCEVDVAAYNVRIMNAHDKEPEKVKELIEEMSTSGLKPDTISYNYLMTCYCKNGMLEEAQNVYKRLEEYGCKPNATTFRCLIYYLCRNERFEAGYKVFKTSVGHNKIPDFNTLQHLVDGLVKKKKMKAAKGLIRTVKKKFPSNVLNAWRKVEENLGIGSNNDESGEDDDNEDDENKDREVAA
ncbi:Pentatricopeptide repeat-containing protein At4g36680, mitochondrial [Linum perenne]